jgi:hypothetical protein
MHVFRHGLVCFQAGVLRLRRSLASQPVRGWVVQSRGLTCWGREGSAIHGIIFGMGGGGAVSYIHTILGCRVLVWLGFGVVVLLAVGVREYLAESGFLRVVTRRGGPMEWAGLRDGSGR